MPELSCHPRQSVSLADALSRVLDIGVVILGEATLTVADIDLVYVQLQLVVRTPEGSSVPPVRADSDSGPGSGPGYGSPRGIRATGTQPDTGGFIPRGEPVSAPRPVPRTGPATDQVLALPPLAPLTSVPKGPASAGSGAAPPAPSRREQGLAKLVLALLKLLHDLMEHQALRRVEGGSLSPADVEKLGDALMRQTQEIERLQKEFGLRPEDVNLDLGPLGKLF